MNDEVEHLFENLCDYGDVPVYLDDYFIEPEDESYDDFLFSGANSYGGY